MSTNRFDIDFGEIPIRPGKIRVVQRLVRNAATDVLDFAEDQAKFNAPSRTGNLKRSIRRTQRIRKVGNVYMGGITVGVKYGKWVESGTGIYGPFGALIKPKTGNVLVWREFNPMVRPSAEGKVFAKWSRGQKGQHFIQRAYDTTERVYSPARLRVLGAEIEAVLNS